MHVTHFTEFHALRGRQLFLESTTKLLPALKLYESVGFVHQPGRRPGTVYLRSDVYMIHRPKAAASKPRAPVAKRSATRKKPSRGAGRASRATLHS